MRITNLDLPDNDLDFIYKTFKDLSDFLSFNVPGEVETTSLTLWTEEGTGNILFECDFKNKKIIYPTKLNYSDIDEKKLFNILMINLISVSKKIIGKLLLVIDLLHFYLEKYDLINEKDKNLGKILKINLKFIMKTLKNN